MYKILHIYHNYGMDKSTIFAMQRTKLSNIRTLLAYINLSLVCISVGLALLKMKQESIKADSIVMFCLSGFFFIVGVIVYYVSNSRIKKVAGAKNDGTIKINSNA